MAETPPVVLTIAGFDPSSGAGITADIKTIAAHECFGVSCITALTVQSTQGVRRVEGVDPGLIRETLQELADDFSIAAVHVGMLGNEGATAAVADFLDRVKLPHVVLDPILKSSSGADLLSSAGTRLLLGRLVPLAEVITPNLGESTALTGKPVRNLDEMREAARRLHLLGAANVIVTGGHLEKAMAIDLLSRKTENGVVQEVFEAERQASKCTHGTGCAFATAVACQLAAGRELSEATLFAKAYVSAAIAHAYPVGHGVGPLHHLHKLKSALGDSSAEVDGVTRRNVMLGETG